MMKSGNGKIFVRRELRSSFDSEMNVEIEIGPLERTYASNLHCKVLLVASSMIFKMSGQILPLQAATFCLPNLRGTFPGQ